MSSRRVAQCLLASSLILSPALLAARGHAEPATSFDRQAAVARAAGYDATVGRDRWGVPRVHGKTDADAAFALGYAFAEDDLTLVEEAFVPANGHRLIARSPAEAQSAYVAQLFRVAQYADRAWDGVLSAEAKAYLTAYADGINLYAAQHPDRIGRPDLFPLTGKDVLRNTIFQAPLFYGMSATLTRLIAPDTTRSLGKGQGLQVGAAPPVRGAPLMRGADADLGSNAFAVAAKRSSDGATRLIANSHQPLEGPLAWLEAGIFSDQGLRFAGGAFPSSPLMHIGANPDLAWTATVNRPDLIDTYKLVVDPARPSQYRLDGEWRTFETSTARIRLRQADGTVAMVERPIRWSAHGPVLDTRDGPVAIRYASMDEARGVETSLRMMKARSVAEARMLLETLTVPSTNRIFADRTGAIARYYLARMPKRIDGPNWKGMLPGDDSRLIWTAFEPFAALPHVENPAEGWVTEANSSPFQQMGSASDPDPARFPPRFGIETELTNRARRATGLMRALPTISRDQLWAVKMDHSYAPESHAALLRSMILAAPWASTPAYAEPIALLKAWDLTLDPDNRSAPLAILTMQPIGAALQLGQKPPELKDAMDAAVAFLRRHHGRLDVPWSQVNQLQRDGVRRPLTGGPDVLRAASSEPDEKTGTLKTIVGDGLVIMAEWDKRGRQMVRSISPFGASGRPGDPHRTDQMDLFVAGKLKPVAMTWGEGLARRYRPQAMTARR